MGLLRVPLLSAHIALPVLNVFYDPHALKIQSLGFYFSLYILDENVI